MNRICFKIIVSFLISLLPIFSFAQLSSTERMSLAYTVQSDYGFYGMEGTQIYNTGKNWVLVAIEVVQSQMGTTAQSRTATMKATRDMAEFLQGASTTTISIYDTRSEDMTSFEKNNKDNTSVQGSVLETDISRSVNEVERTFSTEVLDEKTIQKVSAHVDGMQALQKFSGPNGEIVYTYYLVITKAKSKKKH